MTAPPAPALPVLLYTAEHLIKKVSFSVAMLRLRALCLPCPNAETDEHPYAGNQEEFLSTEFVNKEDGKRNGHEEGPDLQSSVYHGLVMRRSDAHRVEDAVQVVGNEPIAGALGEERDQGNEQQPLPVSGSLDEKEPRRFGILSFEPNGLLNLGELGLYKGIVFVTTGMILFPTPH